MKSPPRPPSVKPAKLRRGARLGANLFDALIVDNFAGAGGASMGIEAALGRSVDIAINHDRHSVEMHALNHPHTRHLCEDVWHVDPLEATAGKPVALLWLSPDCRHFSRAKGAKPVEKKIRGLAWIGIKWAKLTRPSVIILENVREFQDWGPLTPDNRPCPKRKGQTFKRFVSSLRNLGYVVDYRVLNASDFGAPTHRRRFFLIARRDGMPICWPQPTHGPGRAHKYHTAAECIDFSLPCPSIFLTKEEAKSLRVIRPLAPKTMRRIRMGLDRYVINNPKPFIVTCNHSGPEFRGQALNEPFRTVTAARDAHGLVSPFIAQLAHGGGRGTFDDGRSNDPRSPIGTVHAGGNNYAVASPFLIEVQNASNAAGHRSADRPSHTITANPKGGGVAIAAPLLIQNYGEAPHQQTRGQSVGRPLNTITPANNSGVLIAAHLTKFRENSVGADASEPMPTITSGAGSVRPAGAAHAMGVVIAPMIAGVGGPEYSGKPTATDEPLRTVMADNRRSLVAAFLAKHYTGVVGHAPDRPLGTITAVDHHSVVSAFMTQQQGKSIGRSSDEPIGTMTSVNHHGVVSSNLIHFNHGEKQWSDTQEPLRAVTAGGFHAAEVRAFLMRYYSSGGQAGVIDAPAPTITTKDRLGVVTVHGQEFQIVDIGLRMLAPVELLRAQFGKYAKGYILTGTKSQQVARIGNSVPPELAEAIVRANFAEEMEAAA